MCESAVVMISCWHEADLPVAALGLCLGSVLEAVWIPGDVSVPAEQHLHSAGGCSAPHPPHSQGAGGTQLGS